MPKDKGSVTQLGLVNLTPQERMWLWRRREGLTQRTAAKRLGIPYNTYRDREQGSLKPLRVDFDHHMTANERCALARRRAGVTQEAVAKDMGVGVKVVREMESNPRNCDDLICYWDC